MNCPLYGDIASAPVRDDDARRIFHTLIAFDESVGSRNMALTVVQSELAMAAASLAQQARREITGKTPTDWVATISEKRARDADQANQLFKNFDEEACRTILRNHAPIALTDGCWIQFAFCPARSHTETSAALLRAHQIYSGYGNRSNHVASRYLDTLSTLGISMPDVATWAFVSITGIDPRIWRGPAFSLALGEYSVRYLPELLGYNLYKAAYGLSPASETALLALSTPTSINGHLEVQRAGDFRDRLVRAALDAIEAYFVECSANSNAQSGHESIVARMRVGLATGMTLSERWIETIAALAKDEAFTPRGRMLRLVERKGPDAFGYHRHRRLNGQSVDEYLNPAAPRAEALLDALAKTHYVKPGNAAASPFLTHLVQFGGPMFRIFGPDELDIIAQWIDSLLVQPHGANASEHTIAANEHDTIVTDEEPGASTTANPDTPAGAIGRIPLRELYHRLVNLEQHGDALEAAHTFASEWLTRSSVGITRDERKIPFLEYSPALLEQWLIDTHREQVDSYEGEGRAPAPSREQVIRESVQLCPMVLVDGAWLQRFAAVTLNRGHIGSLLYHIYADELGNGSSRENHPNVYRELMVQMGVDLPEFGTKAFTTWEGFDDDSFQVPTFWLAISRFPREFLPELLGVNLAMELSGVGGTYRQGRDTLRAHGFSSAFVDLHNTIDNVSTGHTAMALQAITLYLDEIAARGSREDVNSEWMRVWTGYRALKPPTGIRGKAFLFGYRLSRSIVESSNTVPVPKAYRLEPLWRAGLDRYKHVGAP
jgi:hypothetical protein